MARIVQLANFVAPHSGGIRTTLDALGAGYEAAGHERLLVVPGAEDRIDGHRIVLRSPRIPGQPYRVLVDVERVRQVVRGLRPDRVEVSDKLTLRSIGRLGPPSVLLSHERIDAILRPRVPPGVPLRRVADAVNRRLAAAFDVVVCASSFAASEWRRIAIEPLVVPLGVDLEVFHPHAPPPPPGGRPPTDKRPDPTMPARRRHDAEPATAGRLSTERQPDRALDALAHLRAADVAASPAGRRHEVELVTAEKRPDRALDALAHLRAAGVDPGLPASGRCDIELVTVGRLSTEKRPDRALDALAHLRAADVAASPAGRRHEVGLVTVGRLSTEKRPDRALDALADLRAEGLDAALTFVGDGPLRRRLERSARRRRLPVRFAGHLADRAAVAAVVASADVAVCPCPHETFGLAALEALACGTPIAVPRGGALAELVLDTRDPRSATACGAVDDDLAAATRACVASATRFAARRRAEAFPWSRTVAGLLAAHGLTAETGVAGVVSEGAPA